jgi:hypothetical protein
VAPAGGDAGAAAGGGGTTTGALTVTRSATGGLRVFVCGLAGLVVVGFE